MRGAGTTLPTITHPSHPSEDSLERAAAAKLTNVFGDMKLVGDVFGSGRDPASVDSSLMYKVHTCVAGRRVVAMNGVARPHSTPVPTPHPPFPTPPPPRPPPRLPPPPPAFKSRTGFGSPLDNGVVTKGPTPPSGKRPRGLSSDDAVFETDRKKAEASSDTPSKVGFEPTEVAGQGEGKVGVRSGQAGGGRLVCGQRGRHGGGRLVCPSPHP